MAPRTKSPKALRPGSDADVEQNHRQVNRIPREPKRTPSHDRVSRFIRWNRRVTAHHSARCPKENAKRQRHDCRTNHCGGRRRKARQWGQSS